jgi:transcriptional regulator with XRE-family HTH domain
LKISDRGAFRMRQQASEALLIHVGSRLRARRSLLNISIDELARSVGRPVVQLESFENGTNRIAPMALYELAQQLNVTISYFYQSDVDAAPNQARDLVTNVVALRTPSQFARRS